jgi:primosomal protein N' (replication factor Y)
MRYADVAVDIPALPGRSFTYSIPFGLTVSPGHLVRVPFGRRYVHGIVLTLRCDSPVEETREIEEVVEQFPLLSSVHLEVARWISEYYRSSLFAAAAPGLPPGFRTQARRAFKFAGKDMASKEASVEEEKVLNFVVKRGNVVDEAIVARVLGTASVRIASTLVHRGLLEIVWRWPAPQAKTRWKEWLVVADAIDVTVSSEVLARRAPRQSELLRILSRNHKEGMLLAYARREYGRSAVLSLCTKKLATITVRQKQRNPLEGREFPRDIPPLPTPEQVAALDSIRKAMDSPDSQPRTFLLHGLTGSGKTEVYLRALAHCIERGKRALVLVPEIALTPQTVQRFSARFPGQVALLHSGLSPGEQLDQWWRVYRGDYSVVVGARGAIFAPQPNLGLVVLDEEHEWTYKQQDVAPLYHARSVALKLAEVTGAVVVLGSATPQMESFSNALRGEYVLLELPRRIGQRTEDSGLAKVYTVDMRQELKEGNRGIFSRTLQEALGECLDKRDRAILFLNRRGAASVVQCRTCGHVLRCKSCDITLTFHNSPDMLVCHLCNKRRKPPRNCPECNGVQIRHLGLGTQRVAQEVELLFPNARVMRWDGDVATNRRDHEALMERLVSGHTDVVVGTQMVAKGLHVPDVTLVCAVLADIGLNVPDLRAAERTFQVLCQVAGRAGRGLNRGSVILQTYRPQHYAIQAAALQDYKAFHELELVYRRRLGAPPFGKLIHLVYTSLSSAVSEREAIRLASVLRHQTATWGLTDTTVVGPAPGHPERIRGRYRWHIVLRGPDPFALLEKVQVPSGWVVDVDPVSVT